jgi:hypothetical protein
MLQVTCSVDGSSLGARMVRGLVGLKDMSRRESPKDVCSVSPAEFFFLFFYSHFNVHEELLATPIR